MKVLDLDRPLRWLGPKDKQGHLWAHQDHRIFGWSESNTQFEECWWLTPEGEVIPNSSTPEHIAAIIKDRGVFHPEWLFYHQAIHFQYPIFWTACNLSARKHRPGTLITTTADKSKVTCGSCRRTQGFFSREDVPGDPVKQKVTR